MTLPSLKLFQNLRTLMTPYKVTFESPLELSAQGELSQLTDQRVDGCSRSDPSGTWSGLSLLAFPSPA